ncbi:MAG: hypothetical protein WD607_10720 [Candidatus Paceibacterota bacterium]
MSRRKVDLHGFEYTVEELVSMYEHTTEATQWHGNKLNNDFLKYKTSDTVFILGSGPSINNITESQWNKIAECDSIGFNYWFAHNFVPDMYVFQIPVTDSAKVKMASILTDKFDQYKNIPFILRGSGLANGHLSSAKELKYLLQKLKLYYLCEYPISSRCSISPDLLFRYMDALGFMTYGNISEFIPKWRSTIGLILMLVYQMGYKNIVLCGIDMQDNDHFWDYGSLTDIKQKYQLPHPVVSNTKNIKSFTDKNRSKNTVPKYIYSLRDWFKEKSDVNVYVGNEKTVLYPKINLFEYI